MEKYMVQMVDKYTGDVEETCVDDMVFDTEEEAQEYADYINGCASQGAEMLKMSNPYDYDEDYGEGEKYRYEVAEME